MKKDANAFILKNTKQKDRAKLPDLALRRVVVGSSCVLIRDEVTTDATNEAETPERRAKSANCQRVSRIDIAYNALLRLGKAGATYKHWLAECGEIPETSFKRYRRELIASGRVCQRERDGDSTYFCTHRAVGDLNRDLTEPMIGTVH